MFFRPRFLLILALTLAQTAIADNAGLPCDKPQDAFTKAVCTYELDARAAFIASKIAPDKPILAWLKSIAQDCNADTACIQQRVFTEWLRYSALTRPSTEKDKAISDQEACAGFKQLLADKLANTQSGDTPKEIFGLSLQTDDIRAAASSANVNFSEADENDESWFYHGSNSIHLFMMGDKPATGFTIYDGGTLYCYTQHVTFVDETTRSVDELAGTLPNGCMAEYSDFYQFRNHPFAAKYSPLIDGAEYEVFSLTGTEAKPLCTLTGKQTLKYQSNSKYCPPTNPACALISQESSRLAHYFDTHPDSRLHHWGQDWNIEKNTEENRLMTNAIAEDLPIYPFSFPSNLEIPDAQLADMGVEIGKYSDFRPWQFVKLGNTKYLVSIVDGSYDFSGYIFYVEKYIDGYERPEEDSGFVVVKREKTGTATITITYPTANSGNATAQ